MTFDGFEEVVLNSNELLRSRPSDRPIVFGPNSIGNFLACVFEYLDSNSVICVTAYEVDDET